MTTTTDRDSGWLDWVRDRSEPAYGLPPGAIDSHCHVFGPAAQFPFAKGRKYTPGDAGKQDLLELHRHLGVDGRVIVQASCHGRDNAALMDALGWFGDTARGVVAVGADVTEEELGAMHQAGVRGVRFNFVKRLVEQQPVDELRAVAAKIKHLGWHIVLYFEPEDLADLQDDFAGLGVPLVIDHMGRPDVAGTVDSGAFADFLRFADRVGAWVKVSCPERLTRTGPFALAGASRLYEDVAPFARKVIQEFPERSIWGTDWPHPNLRSHMPDDAVLLGYIPQIAEGEAQQRALLVDNPRSLYWTEAAK